eukprot:UN04153
MVLYSIQIQQKENQMNPKLWIIHPFSLTPTLFYVTPINDSSKGWYAPCIWCASGITKLIGGNSKIYTKLNGEKESLILTIKNMKLVSNNLDKNNLVCHFWNID